MKLPIDPRLPIQGGPDYDRSLYQRLYALFRGIAQGVNDGVDATTQNTSAIAANTEAIATNTAGIATKANAAQEDWIAPTLLNGWVNQTFGDLHYPAGYYKDSLGIVRLSGTIASGTMGNAAFTLPAGYRPARYHLAPVVSAGAFGWVSIDSGGNVVISAGDNTWLSINNITFRAA